MLLEGFVSFVNLGGVSVMKVSGLMHTCQAPLYSFNFLRVVNDAVRHSNYDSQQAMS